MKLRFEYLAAVLIVNYPLNQTAIGDSQILTTSPASLSVAAGSRNLEVIVSYDTDPTFVQTTGVGVTAFYDSSKLSFVSMTANYDEDVIQINSTPQDTTDDVDDLDGDDATDKKAVIAYASLTGAWPDEDETDRPLELFKVTFDAASGTWSGETLVNIVITSGAAGYEVVNGRVIIEVVPR